MGLSFNGRGTDKNPPNRFDEISFEWDENADPTQKAAPKTRFFRDYSRGVLVSNDSPDIPFRWGLNPYRGCEHGCVYCYARPYHEYLGLSSGLDFETMIFVKEQAPELLAAELSHKSWSPESIALGGVTDVYQPIERKLQLTRRCLQVLADARHPCGLVTKNFLVTRDIDVFQELSRYGLGRVMISVTTLDSTLARQMEPRASTPQMRIEAIRLLSQAGISVGVMAAPMIFGLNDHEMPQILKVASEAGAIYAGYVPLRLPYQLGDLFTDWLKNYYPQRQEKILNQIRSVRGGELNDPRFGSRMRGEGNFAQNLSQLFQLCCKKYGLNAPGKSMGQSAEHFRRPLGPQLRLL